MDRDAYILLAKTSIRRLMGRRHCERHGADARVAIRQWLRGLRAI